MPGELMINIMPIFINFLAVKLAPAWTMTGIEKFCLERKKSQRRTDNLQ